jgi:integrase/recombinase XerD
LHRIIERIGERAGVENAHPHRFGPTFAVEYLRNGEDIFTLQRILGHSTLAMVNNYLSLVKDDLHSAHRSASPVGSLRRR